MKPTPDAGLLSEPAKQTTDNATARRIKPATSVMTKKPITSNLKLDPPDTPSPTATSSKKASPGVSLQREKSPYRPIRSPVNRTDCTQIPDSTPPRQRPLTQKSTHKPVMKRVLSQRSPPPISEEELNEPVSPICLDLPPVCSRPVSPLAEHDFGTETLPSCELQTEDLQKSTTSSLLEPSFTNSEQEFICKDDVFTAHSIPDLNAMSIQTSTTIGDDKFTVQELLSTITDIPPFVATKGQVSSKIVEKNTGPHLAPPFDDVIHVIRHSSFRVGTEQQTPVVSTDNVELDVRSVSPGLRNGYVDAATIQPSASEYNSTTKNDVKPDTLELRPDLSEVNAWTKVESTSPSNKETLDVKSFRQRADALEGLLELSAELLQHNRLEELSVVLKPFGKDKVSPRETAIWLAKSFKGMMSDEASRSAT
jgi:NIMA (never in mitosis gene a)-related kinase 1/4/5